MPSETTVPDTAAFPFALSGAAKRAALLAELNRLTALHHDGCPEYRKLLNALGTPREAANLEDVPFIPVRLFKHYDLRSVPTDRIVRTMASSGTSGQNVSRIHLDQITASLQTRALSAIVGSFIGGRRLPMLVVDSRATATNRAHFSARTAGILGFSIFGRDICYALTDDMDLDAEAVEGFLARHGSNEVLVFGFTSVVWQHLVMALERSGRRIPLSGGILIHGGGWKKLQASAVLPEEFKRRLQDCTEIARVHNYYGMVEQTGSIFMECAKGFLHASDFGDVLIRDPMDFRPAPKGTPGLIQLFSTLPHSYPGHSILSEDIGVLHGVDDCPCGRSGSRFLVEGRVKDAEIRGCSDAYDARL